MVQRSLYVWLMKEGCLHFVGNNSVTHYRNVNRRFVGFWCGTTHRHTIQQKQFIAESKDSCSVWRKIENFSWCLFVFGTQYHWKFRCICKVRINKRTSNECWCWQKNTVILKKKLVLPKSGYGIDRFYLHFGLICATDVIKGEFVSILVSLLLLKKHNNSNTHTSTNNENAIFATILLLLLVTIYFTDRMHFLNQTILRISHTKMFRIVSLKSI